MSKIAYTFTSESVSEGHPDKVCDQISDAILDAFLMEDPESHVACETLATTNYVLIAGEVKSNAKLTKNDYANVAREVIKRIGYDKKGIGFSADEAKIDVRLHQQSNNINDGVTHATDNKAKQGAGDQGLMFGYACDETSALMPAPIYYSHRIVEKLAELRRAGVVDFLLPDAKSQVSIAYDKDGNPLAVNDLVVAQMHTKGALAKTRAFIREVIPQVIPPELMKEFNLKGRNCHINSCGKFETGGPDGDCGLTGRKIIVDTYGGMGRHGGGAFSGKDPSKVDRSASYMARYAAKNIVAAGLAKRCEIQVAYSIGVSYPLSFYVNTFGTGKVTETALVAMLKSGEIFDFRPSAISAQLGLKTPGNGWCYQKAAAYGHFGRDCFPWEKTDKIADLRAYFER